MAFELLVGVLEMFAYRSDADTTNPGDLARRDPLREKCKYIEFSNGETDTLPHIISPI